MQYLQDPLGAKGRWELERDEKWESWRQAIPFIPMDQGWEMKPCPPFAGAVVRFCIRTEKMPADSWCSVYLDCFDRLGAMGEPYWEVYPYQDDIGRCAIHDVVRLIQMIRESVAQLEVGK